MTADDPGDPRATAVWGALGRMAGSDLREARGPAQLALARRDALVLGYALGAALALRAALRHPAIAARALELLDLDGPGDPATLRADYLAELLAEAMA
jgi:pimeloyl-ACP methyl ester carboxylesterase